MGAFLWVLALIADVALGVLGLALVPGDPNLGWSLFFVALTGLVVWLIIVFWRYQKVGPNEVLVVFGEREPRYIQGGGTVVWPIFRRAQRLSLELMTIDVHTPEVYTRQGVRIVLDGVAQVKVKTDPEAVKLAAEQFLSRSREDVAQVALQVVDGHMRAILGTIDVENIYLKRAEFAERVREAASHDLSLMGMEIVSLIIRNISDDQGYLEALGKPRVAQVKRDAIIGEAQADREAMAARYEADTLIEQARRGYETRKAEYEAAIRAKRAEADLAYDLQRFKTSQLMKREEIEVGIVEKERSIVLQEKEIQRREKELEALVARPADAERYRIQALAEAERYRLEAEAAGQAEAIRAKGFADADAIKARGASEAETMAKKATSWSQYNEAAVTEMFVDILPKLAQAVSEPLSKTERIVIISGGNDGQSGAGASRITQDVATIISQLPPVIEALTGVKLAKLVERIPALQSTSKLVEAEGEEKGEE